MRQIISFILFFFLVIHSSYGQLCVGETGQISWYAYNGILDDEITDLTTLPIYPLHPYSAKTLYNSKSPANYDNYFGAIIRGFIYVPQSDSVTFNLTGNEQARFYLSTNENPDNKILRAYLNANTNTEEFTKYPTQTSAKILLEAGVNYYFEIIYVDGTGSDFANLFWKTNIVDPNNWRTLTAAYLKDIGCEPLACPAKDTPCNDGNNATSNDKEDGYCHCIGTSTSTNDCIGDRSVIEGFRYDNITGYELNDLYINANYPAMPSYSERFNWFSKGNNSAQTNLGDLVQGYLKVPVSGLYKFNVTGDDQTVLYISSDDDPMNKQAHQCLVSGYSGMTQHTKYQWQSTSFIQLDANQFYYIELNHKQSTGSNHWSIFWQAPFTESGVWKRISSQYIYEYNCGLACMPQGTPCDDGNPFTNNDIYNADCDCHGTPCVGEGCNSPIASYVPYEKCNVKDELDNRADNNWISCTPQLNPNILRPSSHWIKYDLGEVHKLLTSQVWNYNVADSTHLGFQNVAVDYSENGVDWNVLGTYVWSLATGEGGYAGFTGPDFQGLKARYVLFTSLDGTASCRGIGKVAFKAIICPNANTPCNDNNVMTTDDRYNEECLCEGTPLLVNQCEEETLVLGDSLLSPNNYSAIEFVQSVSQVMTEERTSFIGGSYVMLQPGFESEPGAIFYASIDTCVESNNNRIMANQTYVPLKQNDVPLQILKVTDNPDNDEILISFYLESGSKPNIYLSDLQFNKVNTIFYDDIRNKGHYTKKLRHKKIEQGSYFVVMEVDGKIYKDELVVD